MTHLTKRANAALMLLFGLSAAAVLVLVSGPQNLDSSCRRLAYQTSVAIGLLLEATPQGVDLPNRVPKLREFYPIWRLDDSTTLRTIASIPELLTRASIRTGTRLNESKPILEMRQLLRKEITPLINDIGRSAQTAGLQQDATIGELRAELSPKVGIQNISQVVSPEVALKGIGAACVAALLYLLSVVISMRREAVRDGAGHRGRWIFFDAGPLGASLGVLWVMTPAAIYLAIGLNSLDWAVHLGFIRVGAILGIQTEAALVVSLGGLGLAVSYYAIGARRALAPDAVVQADLPPRSDDPDADSETSGDQSRPAD